MRRLLPVAPLSLAMLMAAGRASACLMPAQIDLRDVRYADVVVVGRITHYEIVLDQTARKQRKDLIAKTPELAKALGEQTSYMSDYARFTIEVDEVLRGTAQHSLAATWDNSTFGEPETVSQSPFLIGLRDPRSRIPPLRGPSATLLPSPEPELLTVLQAPCAAPFLFARESDEAMTIRQILAKDPN